MTHEFAGVTCLLNIVGFAYTYSCCLRIYNRFKYIGVTSSSVPWTDVDEYGQQSDLTSKIDLGQGDKGISGKKPRKVRSKPKKPFFSGRFFGMRDPKPSPANSFSDKGSATDVGGKSSDQIRIAGYLTVRKASSSSSSIPRASGAWERQYFVMVRSDLYFYKSEMDFIRFPENPSSTRPLDMSG